MPQQDSCKSPKRIWLSLNSPIKDPAKKEEGVAAIMSANVLQSEKVICQTKISCKWAITLAEQNNPLTQTNEPRDEVKRDTTLNGVEWGLPGLSAQPQKSRLQTTVVGFFSGFQARSGEGLLKI